MPDSKAGSGDGGNPAPAWRDWLSIYAKGAFMGAADTIPGISGGTIALITGIYVRLVESISAFDRALLREISDLARSPSRAAFRRLARDIDLGFLVILGVGVATAVVGVSQVVIVLLAEYRALTNAFFFGLIAASAVVLYRDVSLRTWKQRAAALLAAGFAFSLTGATASGAIPHGFVIVLVTGMITSSAMLLPGISGAALLYITGQYEYMISTLHGFIQALTTGQFTMLLSTGSVVGVFMMGVATGLVTIAHGVKWALQRDRATTLTVLVSLMVGALRLPVVEVLSNTVIWSISSYLSVIGAALAGSILVLLLDSYTDNLEYTV